MTRRPKPSLTGLLAVALLLTAAGAMLVGNRAIGHIVPPEALHPVAESYRRMAFVLNLNPIPWDLVEKDAAVITAALMTVDGKAGEVYGGTIADAVGAARAASAGTGLDPAARKRAAARVFEHSTRAVAKTLKGRLLEVETTLEDFRTSAADLEAARGIWAAFEHEVKYTDPSAYRTLGRCWLTLVDALGAQGVLGIGRVEPNHDVFRNEASEIADYLEASYASFSVAEAGALRPVPYRSTSYDATVAIPAKLPPGSNINKQLPRPRQVLNMSSRGVDESETALIALGDMAFDSPFIFGEPARSHGLSCNTCHNKSITNPNFFIPGVSTRAGGLDVSSNYFAPHANNSLLDPLDIPDLRGIRFTAPYGRNGRFASLREFVRNVIVNEFNGAEPHPIILDGMIAYMLEFDFLPNPYLNADGTLSEKASDAARRGEALFNKPFAQMGDRACASCHVPSDHFLDHRRHDIGTVAGASAHSRDRALDTPTLLSSRYTAPYFHDGRAPTLESVVEWFDAEHQLGLTSQQVTDLTAYLETIGSGEEPYEDTIHTLEAEMEEFSFFLSTYEFLRMRERADLNALTFQTIALEIRAHKWDIQDPNHLPVLDQMAALMDDAYEASQRGDHRQVDARVGQYRALYEQHVEVLK